MFEKDLLLIKNGRRSYEEVSFNGTRIYGIAILGFSTAPGLLPHAILQSLKRP